MALSVTLPRDAADRIRRVARVHSYPRWVREGFALTRPDAVARGAAGLGPGLDDLAAKGVDADLANPDAGDQKRVRGKGKGGKDGKTGKQTKPGNGGAGSGAKFVATSWTNLTKAERGNLIALRKKAGLPHFDTK